MSDQEKLEPWFPVEETLKQDSSGAERDVLVTKLLEQANVIKRKMDAGVPQHEFAQLDKVHSALQVASQLVPVIWGRYHRVQ